MVLISENITENDMAAAQTLVPLATESREDCDLERGQQDFITSDRKMDGVKMSPTNENKSQNSTELENITTGWEIQPYVENPIMKHFCRQSINVELISKVLKQLVTQSTSQLKQVSAWETKLGTTNVVGEISVSFKLPEYCAIDIAEVDKIIRPPMPQDGDLNNVNTQNVPQFSFAQRLNGWNIERRQRSNGKSCDMYYRHESSHKTFRSTVEVVNFLLYEAYPPKQQRANKSKSEGDYLEQRSQHGRGLLKRKMASPISGGSSSKSKEKMYVLSDVCEEYTNATVEELLAAAYLNILNSSSNSSMQGGGEPEFSSDYVDPKEAREMVEEFLDTSYNNLLNHFNEKENAPQENKKGKVDEQKDKGQSGVNPIQEQANVAEVQTNVEEVEDNPTEVEANAGAFSSSPSAYTEQCDLINHIPHVSECELAFLLGNN